MARLSRRVGNSVDAFVFSTYEQIREEMEGEFLAKVKLYVEREALEKTKLSVGLEIEVSLAVSEEQVKRSEKLSDDLAVAREEVERLKGELEFWSSRDTQSRLELESVLAERDNLTRSLDDSKCTIESLRDVSDIQRRELEAGSGRILSLEEEVVGLRIDFTVLVNEMNARKKDFDALRQTYEALKASYESRMAEKERDYVALLAIESKMSKSCKEALEELETKHAADMNDMPEAWDHFLRTGMSG